MEIINAVKRGAIKFALNDGEEKDELLAKYAKKEKKVVTKKNNKKNEKKQIFSFFNQKDVKKGYSKYYTEDEKIIKGIKISKKLLLDENFNAFSKIPTGNSLLSRDLKASKLFLSDEGNIIAINAIKRVYPLEDVENKAYVLLDTKYEKFILEFDMIQTF